MSKAKLERTVRTSFLDRLIDYEPKKGSDRTLTWDESVRQLKATVLRDLEWLLNTRRSVRDRVLTPEVHHSIFNYGLPDVGSMSATSIDSHRTLAKNVEDTIELFEPRLSDVRVVLAESDEPRVTELRILIEATLEMDPSPERVVFDTVVDVSTGRFALEDHDHA